MYLLPRDFYGPLVLAPILGPNIYHLYTIYKIGAIEQTPPESNRAHEKGPQENPGISVNRRCKDPMPQEGAQA